MWVSLILLSFFLVVHSAVCSVSDAAACDQVSKNLAFQFACDDEQSPACFALLKQQLRDIAPVNFPTFDAALSTLRPSFMACTSLGCFAKFLAYLRFARAPSSMDQARSLAAAAKARFSFYDEQCGKTWANTHCFDGCPPLNQTCVLEEGFVRGVNDLSSLLMFNAARREHQHLLRINASCFVQSSAQCKDFISARLTESLNWLDANRPTIMDKTLDTSQSLALELQSRSCEGDLPCVKDVIGSILSASDAASTQQAVLAAKASLVRPVLSPEMEDLVVALVSQPAVPCFWPERSEIGSAVECKAAWSQNFALSKMLDTNFTIRSRLTPQLQSRIAKVAADCWTNCRLLMYFLGRWTTDTMLVTPVLVFRYALVCAKLHIASRSLKQQSKISDVDTASLELLMWMVLTTR